MQGCIAGLLPIYLFSHAVVALGGGRASTFPALVPIFSVHHRLSGAWHVPSLAQLVGMAIVLIGFQFTLRR